MSNLGLNFKIPTQKKIILPTAKVSYKGERTLTPADKRNEKKKRKYECDKCKQMFWAYAAKYHIPKEKLLDVHHKREVYKSKSKDIVDLGRWTISTQKKKKAYHDRPENLEVLCKICHAIEHIKKEK
jgi:hypothetical protein